MKLPTMHQGSGARLIWPLLVVAGLAAPSIASGATMEFEVVNEAGRPQPDARISSSASQYYNGHTNAQGHGEIYVIGGETLRFTRGTTCVEESTTYSVPSPIPTERVRITVPTLINFTPDGSTPAEARELVGLINRERASKSLAPYRISLTLNAVSQEQASLFSGGVSASDCPLLEPGSLISDAGWDITGEFSSFYSKNGSSIGAFQNLINSRWANAHVYSSVRDAIGVARVGNSWAINTSPACQTAYCQMTSDEGVLPTDAPPMGGGTSEANRVKLRVKRRGKRAYVVVRQSEPQRLTLIARRGARAIKRSVVANEKAGFGLKLTPGVWRLRVADECLKVKVIMKRLDRVRLRTSSC